MKSHLIDSCAKRFLLAVLLLSVLGSVSIDATGQTGEPSREPILRIETGMHTAVIRGISSDAANRYLITPSADKTIRVWELATGRLVRIIRPPIGDGREGEFLVSAISPDGKTIAASGTTALQWDGRPSIYLFDRESGQLIRRIQSLPNVVGNLVYSKDGRYLAVPLLGKAGVRVYETSSYSLIGEDQKYGSHVFAACFDAEGRLLTVSYDSFIRLYEVGGNTRLRLLAKRKLESGDQPFSVSATADGSKFAIGFEFSTKVSVFSGRDLSLLYTPDLTGLNNGSMSSVAWSADGNVLYAGGYYQANRKFLIRAWTDAGKGSYQDIVAAANGISRLLTLKDAGVVYSTGEPSVGVIDSNGKVQTLLNSSIADFRDNWQGFLLSSDGSNIRFGYESAGNSPARFSLNDRQVKAGPEVATGLWPPIMEAAGVVVSDWKNNFAPKLNGRAIPLETDVSRSLAISPDGQQFLLGTGFSLRLYDKSGVKRWQTQNSSDAFDVNVSGDGKLALAAYADGTIRWYRMTDGKELLAFFPHADRKRWVLWTPSGYYDASPGAEDLIGWHVNNGKDQAADFFPVGRFRSTYYRPDVISKVLETGDETRALQLANEERGRKAQTATVAQMLPPVVEIASPPDNSEVSASEVTIRYSVRTPSGEAVTNVRALVDGRPVTGNRQLTREDASTSGIRELKVSVPEHDSEVSIIAENRFAASVPATVRLKWHGSAPTTEAFVIQPKLYVLAIGVSQYQNPSYSLKFAAKDAKDFAAAAATQKGFLYRDVVVKVLTDDQATKDNVLDGLDWIRKETTSKDVAMVFFAGHGLNDQSGVYYFLPYNTDLEKLLRTGVPFTDIKNTVQSLAGKTLFFIDTCHSGNVLGGRRGLADDLNGIINELSSAESGAVVFAASTGSQYSLEDAKWNNGAFTKALVEGITGQADYTGKGKITINMLDLYISERVKELTGGKQTPTTAKPNTIQDFPIAVKK